MLYIIIAAFLFSLLYTAASITVNRRKDRRLHCTCELPDIECPTDEFTDSYILKECDRCPCFDGHDICMHIKHFGSVTNKTVAYCIKRTEGKYE